TPLVLIHDGGGTSFAYYCLNPLGRPTYALHNPRFYSRKPWTGGIPEMARHYVELLRRRVPRGPILLGGWSLGGILAVEMARLLAGDPTHQVIGLVMVDSICPSGLRMQRRRQHLAGRRVVPFRGAAGVGTKRDTIERVQWCFSEAVKALEAYELPRWEQEAEDDAEDEVAAVAAEEDSCPPAILLRAEEAVPVELDEVSLVDTARDDLALGWDDYRRDFFTRIIDIPGHHFSVFSWNNVDTVSAKLMEACKRLE
ncbi:alpha/beta-hydrolase, partial [Cryphonectria parasitica EP155]